MAKEHGSAAERPPEAIVAGHFCIDIIPVLPAADTIERLRPGKLLEVGPAAFATGGCVANAGQAMARLGVATRLLGKVGDDALGQVGRDLVTRAGADLARGLVVAPGEHTSYSITLSPPGRDRMFLHFPGANDTFSCDDISDEALAEGRVFLFGYPPLMRRMYQDDGVELARLLRRAKEAGLTTALDMAFPDPDADAGRANWRRILERALPYVDVFVPSLEETLVMLGMPMPESAGEGAATAATAEHLERVGSHLIELGAAIVGLKAGEQGLYLQTAGSRRLAQTGPGVPRDIEAWADRQLWSSIFETTVLGTVGAGDATAAGFLFGLLRNMGPELAVTAACGVGAASVEAADATSGITGWETIWRRISAGWPRRDLLLGPQWRTSTVPGVWVGPLDVMRG